MNLMGEVPPDKQTLTFVCGLDRMTFHGDSHGAKENKSLKNQLEDFDMLMGGQRKKAA